MGSKSADVQVKDEPTNDLQSYLETFNNEISDGSGNRVAVQFLEDEKDPDEESGTYFVDEAGNYYYQATKDSEPVLTSPPDELSNYEICADEEQSIAIIKPSGLKKSEIDKDEADEDSTSQFLLVMDGVGGGSHLKTHITKKDNDDEKDDEFEFDENEEDADENNENIGTQVLKVIKQKYSKVHTCRFCSYSTPKRYLLARHMKCHSEDRPHKCNVCERGFKTPASLHNHINTHTGLKPYSCKDCDSAFTTSGELVRHVRYRHTHEKPHKCTECDYASVELSKLKRHIRCHTGERPYQCPHCTYASPDTFKLKRHLRIHTGEKPYECDICHARFTQSNSLKAHKLIHSVGDKPVFQCELCPTTCGRKTDLRIHVQKLHTSDKPLKCKRCDKMFPDRYSYKVHVKTHEGEKCYKCDVCPYASISARHLEAHILIHTDQKPFECDQCDQAFRQKQLLKRHINLYHNKTYTPPAPREKTHQCPDCERKFRHKGNLIRHMAMHDPDSGAVENAYALKVGRRRRVQFIDGIEVEVMTGENDEDEDDDEMEDEEDEPEETVIEEHVEIKQEDAYDNKNSILAVKNAEGQEYVVLEVIAMDDDQKPDTNLQMVGEEEYIISGDINEEVLEEEDEKSFRVAPRKILRDDKNIESCFGFDDRTFTRYFDATHVTAQLEPTFISKVNTVVQLMTIGISLGAPIWQYADHPVLHGLWYLTGATTAAAALSYILKKDTYKILKKTH